MPSADWDRALADLGGHPLQSALWGDARARIDGIENHRWAALLDGRPVLMARFEVRRVLRLGRVAWLPRGPTMAAGEVSGVLYDEFLDRLRQQGYMLSIDDAYRQACGGACCFYTNRQSNCQFV